MGRDGEGQHLYGRDLWYSGVYGSNDTKWAGRVVGVVSYDNVGYAGLEGCQDTGKPYLFIAGFEEDTYEMLPVQLLEGRLPKDGSEVLIPSHLIADTQREYLAGDTLCLAVGPRQDGDDVLSQHVPYRLGAELLSVGEEQSYTVVAMTDDNLRHREKILPMEKGRGGAPRAHPGADG